MSIWTRIGDLLGRAAEGAGIASVFERLRTPPERSVAFTIAVIALGAKMAKADGRVTRDEVAAFREIFTIPPESRSSAARVYDYARQDVAGFEDYAARVASLFGPGDDTLYDLLDGLFHIATADGALQPEEEAYLRRCAELFGLAGRPFETLRAQYDPQGDPWKVLGLSRDAEPAAVKARWRALARETHPDRLVARGLPEEAVRLGAARLARINAAYDQITALRRES